MDPATAVLKLRKATDLYERFRTLENRLKDELALPLYTRDNMAIQRLLAELKMLIEKQDSFNKSFLSEFGPLIPEERKRTLREAVPRLRMAVAEYELRL